MRVLASLEHARVEGTVALGLFRVELEIQLDSVESLELDESKPCVEVTCQSFR